MQYYLNLSQYHDTMDYLILNAAKISKQNLVLQIRNKHDIYIITFFSVLLLMPLLSAGRSSVLQTSTTSIGMLHNTPFDFGE